MKKWQIVLISSWILLIPLVLGACVSAGDGEDKDAVDDEKVVDRSGLDYPNASLNVTERIVLNYFYNYDYEMKLMNEEKVAGGRIATYDDMQLGDMHLRLMIDDEDKLNSFIFTTNVDKTYLALYKSNFIADIKYFAEVFSGESVLTKAKEDIARLEKVVNQYNLDNDFKDSFSYNGVVYTISSTKTSDRTSDIVLMIVPQEE